jgi:hypothetical protein
LADAVPIETACEACGIGKTTYYTWRSRGETGEEPYAEFRNVTTRARANAKLQLLRRIDDACKQGDWRAAAWRLERGWPDEFGKNRQQHQNSGLVREIAMSDEELSRILAECKDA